MPKDTYIELRSHVGNRITCPSRWEAEDEGAWWTITDGQATILIHTCTVEGSGSPTDFRDLMAGSVAKGPARWKPPVWSQIDLGDRIAARGEIDPADEDEDDSALSCRLYVLEVGRFYHALLLRSSPLVMTLNEAFYESVIRTFKSAESDPATD